jgi:hypothetical protein
LNGRQARKQAAKQRQYARERGIDVDSRKGKKAWRKAQPLRGVLERTSVVASDQVGGHPSGAEQGAS